MIIFTHERLGSTNKSIIIEAYTTFGEKVTGEKVTVNYDDDLSMQDNHDLASSTLVSHLQDDGKWFRAGRAPYHLGFVYVKKENLKPTRTKKR